MVNIKWKVPYLNLPLQFHNLEKELTAEFRRVMRGGDFILREDVKKFEENIASYLEVNNVIGVNSGTDALYLATEALEICPGDEVITTAHSFVATVASITRRGARPVLVDICEDFNIDVDRIEERVTDKTRAIIPVHLNGRCSKMEEIVKIAEKYNLDIIEDAAQALGASYRGRKAGSFGALGCFSTHPMKILSSAGDGGFISTDNEELAEKLRILRDHGQRTKTDLRCFGYNSRLDNLQAAILNVKFRYLDEYIDRKRKIAAVYSEKLAELPIRLPTAHCSGDFFDTYNSYVIRSKNRDKLIEHLKSEGVETFAHFSIPLYAYPKLGIESDRLANTEEICGEVLSLPIWPELTSKQIDYVVNSLHKFFKEN